jgi:hypothetical protein
MTQQSRGAMHPPNGTRDGREPPPLWLVVLMCPLSLGILAGGISFLYHALFAQNPPGTIVVNPVFSLLMLVAGGAGLYAGCLAVYRRCIPARPAPIAVAPPPVQTRRAPAWQGMLLRGFFWLAGAELKLWLLSLFLVGWGAWELYKQERAAWSWHRTEAIVLEGTVVSRYLRTDPPRPPLVPRIRYRYEVAGQSFDSTQVTTGDPLVFDTTDQAEAFLAHHRVGQTIPVLYQPHAPAQAVLIVSRDGGCWLLLGFGVPTLLLTAYLSWKRRGRSEPDIDVSVLG